MGTVKSELKNIIDIHGYTNESYYEDESSEYNEEVYYDQTYDAINKMLEKFDIVPKRSTFASFVKSDKNGKCLTPALPTSYDDDVWKSKVVLEWNDNKW